jgi:regulator of sigma E protease
MFRSLFLISHNIVITAIGIAGLLFLVTIHEFGHFLMCKLFRVRTPSFSIGFGPKIISHKFGDTEFSIAAIPLGGYVEIAGNAEIGQGEQKEASAKDEYSFATKPFYQKFLIMIGGILFNILFAFFIGIGIFVANPTASCLYPFNAVPTIASVEPESPAQKIGLQPGDTLIAINDQQFGTDVTTAMNSLQNKPGETISLTFKRDETIQTLPVTLDRKEIAGKTIGLLGIAFATPTQFSFLASINGGIKVIMFYITETLAALKHMFNKRDVSGMAGPVAIIGATAKGINKGLSVFLFFLAIISISLAILNLLPLPIFDGGQILFFAIEAITGRSLPEKVKIGIHLVSWILLLLFAVYITFKDVSRMLSGFFTGSK